MNPVLNEKQLVKNIETLENYLSKENSSEQSEAHSLIKRGKCFIAYRRDNQTRFAPSRFIGYEDNNIEKHNRNITKHGGVTNQAINKIIKAKPEKNKSLDQQYVDYCNFLGIKAGAFGAYGAERKFWIFKI